MRFEELATETVLQIFQSVPTVSAAANLSSTCSRFHNIFSSSKKLLILSRAAEYEFGPLDDIIQLVTQNDSQPAHFHRDVPISEALVRSVVEAGRVAVKWGDTYPFKKWKSDYENRRMLTDDERFIFRRALYRLWLFTRAFHNAGHSRLMRTAVPAKNERAALLHNFSTIELAEMLDVHNILRDTISRNICPSNGTIRSKFHKRFPESNYQLLFNPAFNFAPTQSSFMSDYYHSNINAQSKFHAKYIPTCKHEPGAEGWGDEILHYYVVEDMLKLDPGQLLWLKENAPFKGQVEAYVRGLGDWFENNGETFVQTLQFVLQQRGEEWEEFKCAVDDGESGVALTEERRDSVV